MSNPSKAKGTRAETKVVNYLKAAGLEAKRQPLSGNKDIGDIAIKLDSPFKQLIIEVKTGKQTSNPNRTQLDEWWRQADLEACNANGLPVLIIVRYKRKLEDADVWFKWQGKTCHLYLDTFADWVHKQLM